jgi:predicted RNase H-like HicB family nuclease
MRYLVVVEQGPTSFGAYVPDLPGCVAAGETKAEALKLIREAIELHISDLKSEGREVSRPTSVSEEGPSVIATRPSRSSRGVADAADRPGRQVPSPSEGEAISRLHAGTPSRSHLP